MEIVGIINAQCDHVLILASVDMPFSEQWVDWIMLSFSTRFDSVSRYRLTDLALAHSLKLQKSEARLFGAPIMDHVHSYDCACSYCANVDDRFSKYLPDYAAEVAWIRWAVPAVHVKNHIEACEYQFATCYMTCTGHFHAETAEQYWVELNQIGGSTSQMNNGHRQDTIIDHHSDWNWKKFVHMCKSVSSHRWATHDLMNIS